MSLIQNIELLFCYILKKKTSHFIYWLSRCVWWGYDDDDDLGKSNQEHSELFFAELHKLFQITCNTSTIQLLIEVIFNYTNGD